MKLNAAIIPTWRKITYSFSETGMFTVEILLRLYLLKFYTDVVGLRVDLAGYAAAFAIIWDAISDPLMGTISDRAKTRWGRRRPFILGGGIALSIAVIAVFYPPSGTQTGLFIYLMVSYLVLNTAFTLISVPHAALGAELTPDADQRTSVFAWRLVFGNAGLLAGTALPGIFSKISETSLDAFAMTGLSAAVIVLFSSLITFYGTKENSEYATNEKQPAGLFDIYKNAASVMKNIYFVIILISFVIAYIGISINSTAALFYYEYRLGLDTGQVTLILVVFILVWSLSVPLWVLLARKLDKKMPAFMGMFLLSLMTISGYPFFPEKEMFWPLAAAVAGGLFTGAIVILDSLVADVTDYDLLKTRSHRAGIYFGFYKLGIKLSRAIALGAGGFLLSLTGYSDNGYEANEKLAWLFGPGVGIFFLLSALVFLLLPWDKKKHNRIQKVLEKRGQKE